MDHKRRFLDKVIACGLDEGTIATDDVLAHADAKVLAESLPVDLKTKLLEASLGSAGMDADLVVETLGTSDLAETVPTDVLWACVAQCAERELGGEAAEVDQAAKGAQKSKSNGAGAKPKPNAKAKPSKGKADKADDKTKGKGSKERKPTIPPITPRAGASSKKKSPSSKGPPEPLIPKDEFDIDTDVGDEDWGVDDIVEVVEEAEVVGAEPLDETRLDEATSDWKTDEETVTRGE